MPGIDSWLGFDTRDRLDVAVHYPLTEENALCFVHAVPDGEFEREPHQGVGGDALPHERVVPQGLEGGLGNTGTLHLEVSGINNKIQNRNIIFVNFFVVLKKLSQPFIYVHKSSVVTENILIK